MGSRVDAVGLTTERAVWIAPQAEHAECDAGEMRQPLSDARPSRPMAIFVPPPIFDEEQAVLALPVPAHVSQKLRGADPIWVEAGEEVARIANAHGAIIGSHITIHAQADRAAREAERVAQIGDVL